MWQIQQGLGEDGQTIDVLLATAGVILDLLLQGKHSCNYSSFCWLCVTATIGAHPYTEVPQ